VLKWASVERCRGLFSYSARVTGLAVTSISYIKFFIANAPYGMATDCQRFILGNDFLQLLLEANGKLSEK
jgi:hypothetical protein